MGLGDALRFLGKVGGVANVSGLVPEGARESDALGEGLGSAEGLLLGGAGPTALQQGEAGRGHGLRRFKVAMEAIAGVVRGKHRFLREHGGVEARCTPVAEEACQGFRGALAGGAEGGGQSFPEPL